jgi:hypothetical protein
MLLTHLMPQTPTLQQNPTNTIRGNPYKLTTQTMHLLYDGGASRPIAVIATDREDFRRVPQGTMSKSELHRSSLRPEGATLVGWESRRRLPTLWRPNASQQTPLALWRSSIPVGRGERSDLRRTRSVVRQGKQIFGVSIPMRQRTRKAPAITHESLRRNSLRPIHQTLFDMLCRIMPYTLLHADVCSHP